MKLSDIKRDLEFEDANDISIHVETDTLLGYPETFIGIRASGERSLGVHIAENQDGIEVSWYGSSHNRVENFKQFAAQVSYAARLLEQLEGGQRCQ